MRESYNAPSEVESFQRFCSGEPVDMSWAEGWHSLISQATSEGRRFARVRVVSVPLSDYSRFGLWAAQFTGDAGEDIRYLPRDMAAGISLPSHDYWLFDSRRLVIMHFGEADKFEGGEVIEDPAVIVEHNYWRDAARHRAIRREEFKAQVK